MGFIAEVLEAESFRIAAKVEKHASAFEHRFDVDEDVDDRRPADHLAAVERPLVALEKDAGAHFARGVEIVGQELTCVRGAVGVRADEPRHHLHVGARDVPAKLDRGHAVLRLGQVLGHGTDH